MLILSPLLLSERLTRVRILVALIGFLGVLIVTRPMMGSISAGTLTAASSAIFFAGSILFTRKLTADQTTLTILTWLVGLQAVFGIICAGIDGDIAAPSLAMTPFIIIIGFAGLLAHACLVQALSLAPVMLVVPIDFLRLPLIAVLAMILFGEHLTPGCLLTLRSSSEQITQIFGLRRGIHALRKIFTQRASIYWTP